MKMFSENPDARSWQSTSQITAEGLARAARILQIRSRRRSTGFFAGSYAGAFRGGGMEFEESRPYLPGDDVAAIDWNATARLGEPYVKRYREERNQTLMLALDVSASMGFGTVGFSKAAFGAQVAALLATTATRSGDRVGFATFDTRIRTRIRPARGDAHSGLLIRSSLRDASQCRGTTDLASSLEALRPQCPPHSVAVVLSDFRDEAVFESPRTRGALQSLARRCDLVCGVLSDPREEELVASGAVRVHDPEWGGGIRVLATGNAKRRARYAAAAAMRRRRLEKALRASGADVFWMRTQHDPLNALVRFFQERIAA